MSLSYFQWNFVVGILFGVIYSIVLALILGVPTLRLRAGLPRDRHDRRIGDDQLFVRWRQMKEITGASEGIGGFADPFYDVALNPFNPGQRYELGPFSYLGRDLWVLTVGWILLIVIVLLVKRTDVVAVGTSPQGDPRGRGRRTGARQERLHVQAAGADARRCHRRRSPACCRSIQKGSIQPDTFNPVITFTIWAILILGGPGRTWSPIIGSMIYWTLISFLENVLRGLPDEPADTLEDTIKLSDFNISQVRFILVGLGLLLLARFRPQGIFGSREEMALDDR